jgi:hypothetical protein
MGAIDAETSENGACRRRPESFAGMPTSTFRSPETTFFARRRPSPLAFRKGAKRRRRRSRGFVSDPGPIDVFVPTNDAFDALLTRI